ncbi:MAG: glycosyltransferase family 2 protein [Marmoricola sp.]
MTEKASTMSRSHNGQHVDASVLNTQLGQQIGTVVGNPLQTSNGKPHGRPGLASVQHVRAAVPLPVSVVIPTWNEGENIGHVLALMPDVEELVIVDAYSEDGTVDIVLRHRPDATIVLQRPAGKGTAMRAGFEVATAEYIVSMDGDGSMHPGEIAGYVALFEQGYDVVKGSRGAVGGGSTDLTPLRRAGNRGLVGLYNTMFGTRLSDLCYGFIGFRRDRLATLGLYADGFEIEVQIIAHAQLAGLSLAELPSREADRLNGESHLNTFKDGRRVLKAMVRSRMSPGREWWRHVGVEAPGYEVLGPSGADHVDEAGHEEPAGTPAPDPGRAASHNAAHTPVVPTQRRPPGASATP